MNLQRTQILSGPTGNINGFSFLRSVSLAVYCLNINGTEIRPLLAVDSAYSLTNWLVKP